MRIISQDGMLDFPYDAYLLAIEGCFDSIDDDEPSSYYIKSYEVNSDCIGLIIATYSTNEKALKAIEMLRDKYDVLEFQKLVGAEICREYRKELTPDKSEDFYKNYFQFPKDDEIE